MKNELSERRSIPTAKPNRANTAVNRKSRPGGCRRRVSRAPTSSEGLGEACERSRVVVGAVMVVTPAALRRLEGGRELDHRGTEDHHEDRREDAEHQREQHLD